MSTKSTRRDFIKTAGVISGAAISGIQTIKAGPSSSKLKPVTISSVASNFEREPLIRPFGFKGGYMKEIWQTAAWIKSSNELHSIGLCTQNVLWSDAAVFAAHSESGANALMFALTEHALQLLKDRTYSTPVDLLDQLLPEVYAYGQKITSNQGLRKTFALNALVGVDNAAWLLYAKENGLSGFDEMIPPIWRRALSNHHSQAAAIPLMAYNIPVNEIVSAVDQGYFFMKIKIGQPGTQEEMLEKDKSRISAVHQAIGNRYTPHTKNGKLPYYFDANGRYEKKETLLRLLDHTRKIGAFDQIVLIEEPFAEEMEMDVKDIPVRLAADESAHTDMDAIKRIEMGYRAIALKAIAKTLSMTLKIATAAYDRHIPCFCADLTVNPILADWNKNVAARLDAFPGLANLGLVESNGHQNYRNWNSMLNYLPIPDGSWVKASNGLYNFGSDFYSQSGGILTEIPHYEEMFSIK